jgi:endonuclease/exonuclease/phosphatase family metal-dependent hydrolase
MLTFVSSMKIQLILLISFLTFEIGFGQSDQLPSPPEKIKILSWNIYMLPSIVMVKGKADRAQAIGEVLRNSDYDVIVFQEAFQRRARKKIYQQLKEAFPYQTGPANQKLISLKTNSGIWIFSKHSIAASKSIIFNSRSGIDAFSRKGGLIAEITIGKTPIQIAGTHLQNAGQAWIRQSQCVEFYNRLLKPFQKEGVPQVLCGDFNINREKEEYTFMLQTLKAEDGNLVGDQHHTYDRQLNDLHVEPGNKKDLIDYILIRDQNHQILHTTRQIKMIKKPWHARHADLSDHYALEADIQLTTSYLVSSLR